MAGIGKIYDTLLGSYGPQGWWPTTRSGSDVPRYDPSFKDKKRTPAERFEICVGAILTQSTSWKNVENAISELKRNGKLNPKSIGSLPVEELAKLVKSSGYHNQKAKKLKEFVKFRGAMERDALLSIWGLGPETVDSILLYAHNQPIFVIDAYTRRIFSRLGFCGKDASYDELQGMFHDSLKKDAALFNEYHALIVEHAKQHCRTKPVCAGCPLNKMCKKK